MLRAAGLADAVVENLGKDACEKVVRAAGPTTWRWLHSVLLDRRVPRRTLRRFAGLAGAPRCRPLPSAPAWATEILNAIVKQSN